MNKNLTVRRFLLYLFIILIEGAIIWWIVDGFLRLDEFYKIQPLMGPWNLTLAFLYLMFSQYSQFIIFRESIYPNSMKYEDDVLAVLLIIFVIVKLICIGFFWWFETCYWDDTPVVYQIAWILVMLPPHIAFIWYCCFLVGLLARYIYTVVRNSECNCCYKIKKLFKKQKKASSNDEYNILDNQ